MNESRAADRVRILVADDHPSVRAAIAAVCADDPDLEIVGEASDGQRALDLCESLKPDVLVLDLGLPVRDGLDVARMLKESGSSTRVLVITARDDPGTVLQSMRAGVDGLLDKITGLDSLVDAIHMVAAGKRLFTTEQQLRASEEFGTFVKRTRAGSLANSSLTAREQEVFRLICDNLTTRQMSTRLKVSERTVQSHITNLYKKLGVTSRVQAVSAARRLGFIDQ